MPLNFSGQSLIGRSFIGTDLSGADFSFTDIRSANFTGANLVGANFQNARGGLSKRWQWLQLLLLILCSATVGVMGVIAGTFTGTFLVQNNVERFTVIPGLLGLMIFTAVSLPLVFQGFTPKAFRSIIAVGTAAIVAITIGTFISTTDSADSAGGITGGLVLLIANAVILTIAGLTGGRSRIYMCLGITSAIAILSYPIIYPVAVSGITDYEAGLINRLGMVAVVIIILIAGAYSASRVLAKDENFDLIQKIATTFTSKGGTCFHKANLTDATFTQATLKCTDFSQAQLRRTSFYEAKQLNTAGFADTIFIHPKVRNLAATRQGKQRSYQGLNLGGIDLNQADLSGCDFSDSNLNHAGLVGAIAPQANFTRTQAIGTDFTHALLTGSCLEAWNIDSTTQLSSVDCEYIYLRAQEQERRPSSGQFKSGEFTKLFQEIVDTIDLIFQGGINWKALHSMIETANQQQTDGPPLTLRSIENKDDGVVVVKIDAPPEVNKAALHTGLTHHYEDALQALKASYQAQIEAKDEQIAIYREQQANFSAIAQVITSQFTSNSATQPTRQPAKLVCLKLSSAQGATQVTLQIGDEGKCPFLDHTGSLPDSTSLIQQCKQWQTSYRHHLNTLSDISTTNRETSTELNTRTSHRLSTPIQYVTNVSVDQTQRTLWQITQQMHHSFNQWLATDTFRPLREKLLESLSPTDTIRIVLQTDNPALWQLPWHSWDLLSRYPYAEITLSTQHYQHRPTQHPPIRQKGSVRILAILGQDDNLDLQTDCQHLESLPSAQMTVLQQPTRQTLNDHLWEQPWDVLFFAGHSTSAADPAGTGQGYLQLNATDSLSLNDIHYALQKACAQGLQLAIFNACDGLGLVHSLSELPLSQMIVMREAIPDQVAQIFLHNLLKSFASGQPLPQAVREAREQLQGIEDRFPCATWLPILCQTAATEPLTWQALAHQ